MGQQNIWRLASGAAAAWSILEGCCLFHAWEAMVVIWTMIDDMRSWFGRREFDPLWVLRRCWFVEEEDRLRLSQMKCYSGSVCSCKVYGSCRGIYGRPPRNSWELSFWSRSRTACIVNVVTTPKRASWAKMSPYVFGLYTVLILWGFRNQFNCSVLCDSPLGFNVKIKWESKKLKIRCFLCIWRLATYVIKLYKP